MMQWLDFNDPEFRRIVLRAGVFTFAAAFLLVHALTIAIRAIRGHKDSLVVSELIVTLAVSLYFGLLAPNYWGVWTAPEGALDFARGWLGLGALIGFPIGLAYLVLAIHDEWMFWRAWRRRRRSRKDET